MTTLHTPGTWYAKDGQVYPEETGKTLALIPYFDPSDKEAEANANLIAAAPDLLDLMRAAVARIELANAEGDAILSAWLIDARAAIAKATGE